MSDSTVSIRQDGDDHFMMIETPNIRVTTSLDNVEEFLDAYEKDDHQFTRRNNPFMLVNGELHLFIIEAPGPWKDPYGVDTTAKITFPQPGPLIYTLRKVYREYEEKTQA